MAKRKNFSVKALIKWLETKPESERYDWSTASNCLLGQWCRSQGLEGRALHSKSCELGKEDAFYDIALRDTSRCTFGEALRRASSRLPSNK
jgi:hypothetical protein